MLALCPQAEFMIQHVLSINHKARLRRRPGGAVRDTEIARSVFTLASVI